MINDYKEVKVCVYKDEHYSVRDNGAVMRHLREGKKARKDDGVWTFGLKNPQNGYMMLGQHRVHIIVATAFLGARDSKVFVVDHIDTNHCNNRVENLRWFTKLENALNNEITRNKIIYICGSIEAFIENPSILRERLRLVNEPSLEWMRTVTKEEAATAYENLKKYWAEQAQNPKPLVGGKMNDSVYRKQETTNPSLSTNNVEILGTNVVKSNLQDPLRSAIIDVCKILGYTVSEKHQGRGLKADVYIDDNGQKYAFEIHAASQSLRTIRERQAKYIRDGITCCWLHEREKRNMGEEFEELPLFQFTQTPQGNFNISLKGRKTLTLTDFVRDFLNSRIKFCKHIRRSPKVGVKFLKMHCYNCGAENHIYEISPLSTCGIALQHSDSLWTSNKLAFHPEIVQKIKEYTNSEQGKHIHIGDIKERYGRTVDHSYQSFGCYKCDALFGDWFVEKNIMESLYEDEVIVDHTEIEVNIADDVSEYYPHWCHSSTSNFCE